MVRYIVKYFFPGTGGRGTVDVTIGVVVDKLSLIVNSRNPCAWLTWRRAGITPGLVVELGVEKIQITLHCKCNKKQEFVDGLKSEAFVAYRAMSKPTCNLYFLACNLFYSTSTISRIVSSILGIVGFHPRYFCARPLLALEFRPQLSAWKSAVSQASSLPMGCTCAALM